jgi:hypothetical protein
MQLQIHALRFADDDDERALKKPFNSQPSKFDIEPGVEVTIKAKDGVAMIQIGDETPHPFSLEEYAYTAVALTYE